MLLLEENDCLVLAAAGSQASDFGPASVADAAKSAAVNAVARVRRSVRIAAAAAIGSVNLLVAFFGPPSLPAL